MPVETAVIGGGISGLASAFRAARLGQQVTLFEGESFLGGLGTTFPYRGGTLERFYHCILPTDQALQGFIRDVGLESELLWRGTDMGFMYQRRVYPLNTPMDLLRFAPLSLIDRLRMGLMGVRARIGGMNPKLDYVPVDEWIRGLVGERTFEVVWKPLLEAKIGDRYSQIPARWLSSRMAREKSTQRETKGCLRGGYQSLIEAFQRELEKMGTRIRFRTRIGAIERDGERMALRLPEGSRESFDVVIATSPLVQFQAMTRGLGLDPRIADLKLDYQGVLCGVFLLEKPPSAYYWMPTVASGATCAGIVEMSNLMPLDRSHGLYVCYLINYTHRDSELFKTSDERMLERYRRDLAELFPEAGRTVVDQFLFRAPFVEPIWPLGYGAMRPPTSILSGRLYLACTAQAYPRVNSWNSCCEVVEEMMPQFAQETNASRARETANASRN